MTGRDVLAGPASGRFGGGEIDGGLGAVGLGFDGSRPKRLRQSTRGADGEADGERDVPPEGAPRDEPRVGGVDRDTWLSVGLPAGEFEREREVREFRAPVGVELVVVLAPGERLDVEARTLVGLTGDDDDPSRVVRFGRSVALSEAGEESRGEDERGEVVDVDRSFHPEVGASAVGEGPPGVVDQNVDSVVGRFGSQISDRVHVEEVGDQGADSRPARRVYLVDHRRRLVLVPAMDEHRRPAPTECEGRFPADTVAGTGDEHGHPVESVGVGETAFCRMHVPHSYRCGQGCLGDDVDESERVRVADRGVGPSQKMTTQVKSSYYLVEYSPAMAIRTAESLADIHRIAEGKRRTVTVYASTLPADLSRHFGDSHVELRHVPMTLGGEFVVVSDDEEAKSVLHLDDVTAFTGGAAAPDPTPDREERYREFLSALADTTFSSLNREQLIAATREFEDRAHRVAEGRFYAGFQSLSNLTPQLTTYRRLGSVGLEVHVFGTPDWTPPTLDRVVSHPVDDPEIADSWLVAYDGGGDDEQKCALLAEQRSAETYYGIWTYDPDLVDTLVDYLDRTYLT